eukprot:5353893-Pyramimonas_sp.AAC.1
MVEADARGLHLDVGVRAQHDVLKVGVSRAPRWAREARGVELVQTLAVGLEDGPAADANVDAVLISSG